MTCQILFGRIYDICKYLVLTLQVYNRVEDWEILVIGQYSMTVLAVQDARILMMPCIVWLFQMEILKLVSVSSNLLILVLLVKVNKMVYYAIQRQHNLDSDNVYVSKSEL